MRDFNHTVVVLVKAFFDGTLKHGDCDYCAVGNIVHAAGAPRSEDGFIITGACASWKWAFYTEIGYEIKQVYKAFGEINFQDALKVIHPTGYTWQELSRIEKVFELEAQYAAKDFRTEVEAMFKGLMAVVDVLAEIHGIDLKEREEAKALFVKA